MASQLAHHANSMMFHCSKQAMSVKMLHIAQNLNHGNPFMLSYPPASEASREIYQKWA
jgi:hypothetical protein